MGLQLLGILDQLCVKKNVLLRIVTGSNFVPMVNNIYDRGGDKSRQTEAAFQHTNLEHNCKLNLKSSPYPKNLTNIICTVGPSCYDIDVLADMMMNGMSIARISMVYQDYVYLSELLRTVRKAAARVSKEFGNLYVECIGMNTRSCEIRTGVSIKGDHASILLELGSIVRITADPRYEMRQCKDILFIDYEDLINSVTEGDTIYLDKGRIMLRVQSIDSSWIHALVENGGLLGSRRKVNLPGIPITLSPISEQLRADLEFAIHNQVDVIFIAFVRYAQTVKDIRAMLGEKAPNIMLIATIENQQGMDNIDDIIEAADGIMIGRSELSLELPLEKLILAQKLIIAKCNKVGKPVVCSTHLLDSMTKGIRPSRAEILDTANSVLDGADCVTLTRETARGHNPPKAVQVMADICREAESAIWERQVFQERVEMTPTPLDSHHSLSLAAVEASLKINASAILVLTTSGRSAQLLARYRPRCPIVALTRFGPVARQLRLWRGVIPIQITWMPGSNWEQDVRTRLAYGVTFCKRNKIIFAGDAIILVTGWRNGSGFTNTMRIVFASPTQTDQNPAAEPI